MSCMKCGREVEEGQLFCEECRLTMEKYPVKPGIAIQLPRRDEPSPTRKSQVKRRAAPTAEDKIRKLKKKLRTVFILWIITLLLLAATVYPTVVFIREIDIPLPGQNYKVIETTEATEPQ